MAFIMKCFLYIFTLAIINGETKLSKAIAQKINHLIKTKLEPSMLETLSNKKYHKAKNKKKCPPRAMGEAKNSKRETPKIKHA